jgi:TolB-like protein/Tfp pilus assembly protein PilF
MLYVFDDFVLDTDRRELRRGTMRVDLEPQVFDLLAYLLRTRDRVASRDDLIAAVWHGRIVSESTLSSRINAARSAIGDDGAAQRLIRTLPRKGFRFVGEAREQSETPTAVTHTPTLGSLSLHPSGPTIAVLPFSNMSGDTQSDYFADGITEEIITALSHCSGIQVIARNSSFIYKGRAVDVRTVGRELGVRYVLEGSVRHTNGRLRITAQLIESSGGTHLWADKYDGSLSDVFELQDRIAATAASIIEPRLRFSEVERLRRSRPQNMDAYDLWLRAVSLSLDFTEASMVSAIAHLERAIEIDPSFALAMASHAYYQAQCYFQGWKLAPEATHTNAAQLAWTAVEIAKNDANVLWQSAFAVWTLEKDGPRARELCRRALLTNPNSAMALAMTGWIEAVNGNPEGGRRLIEQSQRLNPQHPRAWFIQTGMALACLAEGKYSEAAEWAERALMHNRRIAVALRVLAVAQVNTGQLARAKMTAREILAIHPSLTITLLRKRLPFVSEPLLTIYLDSLKEAGIPCD